jgi:alpha-1,3-rhamnosyl/mannosyltransferase
VRFVEGVPTADLPALYSAAAAFVYPSLYEGFGLPPLEAMACGTPVVCSNAAALPEVTGDAAVLVDPRDEGALAAALERVLDDSALRASLRGRALERARWFTWERCARATLAAYDDVIG